MRFWKQTVAATATAALASALGLLLVLMPASGAASVDQQVAGTPTGWVHLQTTGGTTQQTFTPVFPTLTAVDVHLRTDAGGLNTVDVDVTLDVYRSGDGLPSRSSTVTLAAGSFAGGWVPFDFSTLSVTTSPPQQYILDVYISDTTDQLSWSNDIGSTYAGGQGFLGVVGQSYDFLFKTYLEDTTGPSITSGLSVLAQPDNWYKTNVGLTWTVTDPDSPITSTVGCAAQNIVADQAITVYSCSATSTGGTTGPVNVSIGRDTVKPVISLNTITPPNGNGWNSTDVTASFSCTDALSGVDIVATSLLDVTLTTEGAGQSITSTGQCVDNAGNMADPLTVNGINIDKTAPTEVTLVVSSGTLGDNGWYTSDIVVSTTGTDSISGPVTCTADQPWTSEEDAPGKTFTGSCTNQAGLSTDATPLDVKIDKTAPTNVALTVTAGTLGDNGWYKTDVTVTTTSDAETISDPVVCTADQQQTTDTAGQVFNGSCTNDAGLTADADALTIKLDKTPPALAPTVPASITQNSDASATPNATDATSGVASSSCGALVTTTLGTFKATCTATDNAGNTKTVDVEYTVISTTADCGKILFGTAPPTGGGVGTFAFTCGSIAQLIAVTGCAQATMAIYYNKPAGDYAVYIPASQVSAVNQDFVTIFSGDPQIPANTIFSVKCV